MTAIKEIMKKEKKIKPTKTFKYLFEPYLNIFSTPAVRSVFNEHESGIKVLNVFLADLGTDGYSFNDGILHIVCHIPSDRSMAFLRKLKIGNRGHAYIDSYVVHRDPRIVVIQYKIIRGHSFKRFLMSDYKSMYKKDNLLNDKAIKNLFIRGKNKKGKLVYTKAFRVLTDDDTLRTKMAESLDVYPDQLKQLVSKLNFDEEVVNIRDYVQSIQAYI